MKNDSAEVGTSTQDSSDRKVSQDAENGKESEDRELAAAWDRLERSLPADKVWLLRRLVWTARRGEAPDPRQAIAVLQAHIKSRLLTAAVLREVGLYGEPVHSLEEMLKELEEEEERYSEPLRMSDIALVKGMLRGQLVAAGRGRLEVADACLRSILARLLDQPQPALQRTVWERPEQYTVTRDFPELEVPDILQKHLSKVDNMMAQTLTNLFEMSKLEGAGRALVDWLSQYLSSELGLIVTLREDTHSKKECGLPVLLARTNVIEKDRLTVCIFGFLGSGSGKVLLPPDLEKHFTKKRFMATGVHLLMSPLVAYLAALGAVLQTVKEYPFNVKVVLFPFLERDEGRMREAVSQLKGFLGRPDFCLLANGVDSLEMGHVTSAVGERSYRLAALLPENCPPRRKTEKLEQLKIILLQMMDLIRHYKRLIKKKKTMELAEAEHPVEVELGELVETTREVEVEGRRVKACGWESDLSLKFYLETKHLTAALTSEDIHSLKATLLKTCLVPPDIFLTVVETGSCREFTVGQEVQKGELCRLLRLALLRSSAPAKKHRAHSALPLPRVLQKLLKKESIIMSFPGIKEHGHHAVTFYQVRDAVRLCLSLLVTLANDGGELSEEQVAQRRLEVEDVTALIGVQIGRHLEQPFPAEGLRQLFGDFRSGLGARRAEPLPQKRPVSHPAPAEVGLTALYRSPGLGLLAARFPHLEKLALQRSYLRQAEELLRAEGSIRARVAFLLFLLQKKRRSDIICNFSEVLETRFKDQPNISPIAAKSKTSEFTLTVSRFSSPPWFSFQEETYSLINNKNRFSDNNFLKLTQEIIYNIAFDGEPGSPIDCLFNIIVDENKTVSNNVLLNKICTVLMPRYERSSITSKFLDVDFLKYPVLVKNIPHRLYNFDKCFKMFSSTLVNFEELKNYVIMDTIKSYINGERTRSEIGTYYSSCEPCCAIEIHPICKSEPLLLSETNSTNSVKKEELKHSDEPVIYIKGLSCTQNFPYKRSKKWYVACEYLLGKSIEGIKYFNELWVMYKTKVKLLSSGVSPKSIFLGLDVPEKINDYNIHILKKYIKYALTVLQHYYPLYWSLEDLHRLYFARPEFLLWEAFYIIRDLLAFPCPPPPASHELKEYVRSLVPKKARGTLRISHASGTKIKSDGWAKCNTRRAERRGSSSANENVRSPDLQDDSYSTRNSGTAIPSKTADLNISSLECEAEIKQENPKIPDSSNRSKRRRGTDLRAHSSSTGNLGSTVLDNTKHTALQVERDMKLEMKRYLENQANYKDLVTKREAILNFLKELWPKWQALRINQQKEFEDILILNINYWNTYDRSDVASNHKDCFCVYDKTLSILQRVGSSEGVEPQKPGKPKNYFLSEKRNELCKYFIKKKSVNETIYKYLAKQASSFCKRPREYYLEITDCYTAIINMVNTITDLQASATDHITPSNIRKVRAKFPFLHELSNL